MYQTEEERLEKRAARVAGWLEWMEDVYANLISRPSETASVSGFDDQPRTKPCEHRVAWRMGKLCLACDNTGWRPLTLQERDEGQGIDPYAADISRGVTIVRDESPSSRRAREAAHIDHVIEQLKHLELVRSGEAVIESPDARTFRQVNRKDHVLNRILSAVNRIRDEAPTIYESITRQELCFWVAKLVRGVIDPPPTVAS